MIGVKLSTDKQQWIRDNLMYLRESGRLIDKITKNDVTHEAVKYGKLMTFINACGETLYAPDVCWFLSEGIWPNGGTETLSKKMKTNLKRKNLYLLQNEDNTECLCAQRFRYNQAGNSGRLGVSQRRNGTWTARISIRGEMKHIGSFKTFEEACRAREKSEVRLVIKAQKKRSH